MSGRAALDAPLGLPEHCGSTIGTAASAPTRGPGHRWSHREATVPEHPPDPPPAAAPAELPPATLEAVRAAVRDLMLHPGDGEALRARVCELAQQARARAIVPERVLVALKAVWAAETGEHPMPDRRLQTELCEQMVAHCIRSYFAEATARPA